MQNVLIAFYLFTAVLLALLGLLIFREQPRQRVNQVTATMLFFAAIGPLFATIGLLLEAAEAAPALNVLRRLFVLWEFFFPQLVLFTMVYPREHRLLEIHPRFPLLLYLPQAFHLLLLVAFDNPDQVRFLLTPETLLPALGGLFEPVRITLRLMLNTLASIYTYHEAYFALINMIYAMAAVLTLSRSTHRRETLRLRKQVQWIVHGIWLIALLYTIAFLLSRLLFFQFSIWRAYVFTTLGLWLGAGTITWAIIRYHFLDIQFLLRRGFVFSITTGVLVGLYLYLYSVAKSASTGVFGEDSRVVDVLFLIVAIALFQPLLNFFENLLDRLFYRHAGDHRKALQSFSQEVLTILDIDALRERLVNRLTEALLVESVYLWLPAGDHFEAPVWGRPNEPIRLAGKSRIVSMLHGTRQPLRVGEVVGREPLEPEIATLVSHGVQVLFPLLHRDALLGILGLGAKVTRTPYSYEEMTMLSLLADQLAVSLENISLYEDKLERQRIEEEMKVARDIQQSLLPRELPCGEFFELYALNVPSQEIGGDYFDALRLGEDRLGVAIGDVSGKGIPGAILMSNLQAAFRAYAARSLSPQHVVSQVNDHLAYTTAPEKYVTFFYGVLEGRKRRFTYTNAGHNYPLLFRKGEIVEIRESNLIVGVKPGLAYRQKSIKLQPGDILVLYTDGVTEAANEQGEFFGEARFFALLRECLRAPLAGLPQRIYEQVRRFSNRSPLQDDFTLILLCIH